MGLEDSAEVMPKFDVEVREVATRQRLEKSDNNYNNDVRASGSTSPLYFFFLSFLTSN